MTTTDNKQLATANNTAVAKFKDVTDDVLERIKLLRSDGSLILPKDYSVENHMKSAYLVLQDLKDRNGKLALTECTRKSVANALLDMVLQGLSVSKNQGYFIVYGKELKFIRSYFGAIYLAKRVGGIKSDPVANVIYEGDDFVYTINSETARISIVKHEQKMENIDDNKIKGAYALVTLADGSTQVTIMSMAQIRNAWGQGATKGESKAHKVFTDQMAKRTVINRALKTIINSSDDAWLYDEQIVESSPIDTRNEIIEEQANRIDIAEDVPYENVDTSTGEINPSQEKVTVPDDTEQVPY